MKYLNKSIKSVLACLIVLTLGSSVSLAAKGGNGGGGGGGGSTPAPTVSLSASPATIDKGQSATLSWSSTDANSCSASWTDSSATSGSASVSPTATKTYSISCIGDGGSADDSVTVIVNVYDLVGDYVGGTNDTQVYDTSFAVEFSYSCLGGGCHETNQTLVDEYAASKMTHAMVKCNACHGTHAADTVGEEKPNLTGYYPGIGATGYAVDTDRCKVCHNNEHTGGGNKSGDDCYSCHVPHVFGTGGSGGPGGRW